MAYRSAPQPLSPGKTIRAVRLYRQGLSLLRIGALLGRDAKVVRLGLINAGVEIRRVGRPERQPPGRNLT